MFIFMLVTKNRVLFFHNKENFMHDWLLYGHAENGYVEWSTLLILFKLHGSCFKDYLLQYLSLSFILFRVNFCGVQLFLSLIYMFFLCLTNESFHLTAISSKTQLKYEVEWPPTTLSKLEKFQLWSTIIAAKN